MKKVLLLFTFVLSLFALSGCQSPSLAQQITLVQNGKSTAQIVISATSNPTEKYAAQELQRAIQKISGAQLPIVNDISKSTFNVVIGTPQNNANIKTAHLFNTQNAEETRVFTQGKVLFLAGPTPRGALYAVYTFLQDELNCRWYWPGESGEYLPRQNTIAIDNLDIRQLPGLRDRSLSINSPHYDEDVIIWMARNRLNWHHLQGSTIKHENITNLHEKGLQVVIGGHNITLPPKMLEQHPDYVAMVGGKRQIPERGASHLCWSNAGVQKAVAEKIEKWWDENPNVDSVSFLAADQTHFCECDQCKIMAPDISTRWQKFCAIVMQQVNKTHPGKHYQALAYQAYRDVPTEAADFDLIGYTTYNINYTKPITDPSNAKARGEIEAWQKLNADMAIRGYQFIPFNKPMYAPIESLIVQEIAWAHQHGLKGWKSEVTPFGHPKSTLPQDERWVTNRMAIYAAAQAMWNADINPQYIVNDWSQHVFGPAAAPMESYYQSMQNAWENSVKPLTYFLQPPASFAGNFISDDLLKKAETDFKNARTALNGMNDAATKARIETQINLESAMLDNWRKVLLLQQGRAGHFKAEAAITTTTPQMTAQPDDPAWNNITALPAFEDKDKQPAAEQTKVLLQWDKDALYLRFVLNDAHIDQLKTNASERDAGIFGDDCIELFFDNPAETGHYFHLAANSKAIRYDAKADGAMNFDKSWNPDWTAKTWIGKDRWILDIKLPFASFGIDGKEGNTWRMSFKRSGAGRRANTGWPDASYHNPAGFGDVNLVQKVTAPKRVLMYDAGRKKDSLHAAMTKVGFMVRNTPIASTPLSDRSLNASNRSLSGAEGKSTFTNNYDALTLYHPSTGGFDLSPEVMQNTVLPFLQNGGLVLIAATGNLPLDQWFPALGATVKWSGWTMAPMRRTSSSKDGGWQTQPHDLSNVIEKKLAPGSAYQPTSGNWEILASQKTETGEDIPYLLRLKVGKGTLIITSSNFGYGGGAEMFGSANPDNAAMLLDNLLAANG